MDASAGTSRPPDVWMRVLVPVGLLMYGCDCWCFKKEDERRLCTAEIIWFRREE